MKSFSGTALHLLVHLYIDGNLQVNKSKSAIALKFDGKEISWESGENLLRKLESENIVKQVFPLHGTFTYLYYQIFSTKCYFNSKLKLFWLVDDRKRHKLLRNWALHWWDLTTQPIDEIYSYYGSKVNMTLTYRIVI